MREGEPACSMAICIQRGSLKDDLGTCKLAALTYLTAAWTLILHINTEDLTSDLEETYSFGALEIW